MSKIKLAKFDDVIQKIEPEVQEPIKKTRTKKLKPRLGCIGKYKINLEEQSLLQVFVRIGAKQVAYNTRAKEFDILGENEKRMTSMTVAVFENIPKDKPYDILDILQTH